MNWFLISKLVCNFNGCEAQNLVGLCERILPFPPGYYFVDGRFVRYADLTTVEEALEKIEKPIDYTAVQEKLNAARARSLQYLKEALEK